MISTVLVTIVGIILIFVYAGHWVRIIILNRGEARIFQRGGGGHSRDPIRGSPTIYGLYRRPPSGTPPPPPSYTHAKPNDPGKFSPLWKRAKLKNAETVTQESFHLFVQSGVDA